MITLEFINLQVFSSSSLLYMQEMMLHVAVPLHVSKDIIVMKIGDKKMFICFHCKGFLK